MFYETLGLRFLRHSHGAGPVHYAFERAGHTFEIYPLRNHQSTIATRIGFSLQV